MGPLRPLTAGLLLVALAAASGSAMIAACAPISPAPAPAQPFNSCPSHPCTSYAQSLSPSCSCVSFAATTSSTTTPACLTQACVAQDESLQFFLRIDVPESSSFAPGITFLMSATDIVSSEIVTDTCTTTTSCTGLNLPPISEAHGTFLVDYPTTESAGFNLGNGPADAGITTTLPVSVTLTPLFSAVALPRGETPPDARLAGLVVEPPTVTLARETTGEGSDTESGPYGSPPLAYRAPLEPGPYAITVAPAPPFDAYFPPYLSTVTVPAQDSPFAPTLLQLDLPASARATHVLSSAPLDGMVAYLRDAAGRRISTRVALQGQDAVNGVPVQLQTTNFSDLSGDFFVIAPADADAPAGHVTFTNSIISITSGGLGTEQKYPPLPAPVSVSGQIVGAGGAGTACDVVLTSTAIHRLDTTMTDNSLSYTVAFSTDASGTYSAVLPPGSYQAVLTPRANAEPPDAGVPPARTVTTLDVSDTPASQNGKTLTLEATIALSGTCKVADGRALAAATVQLVPSSSLFATPGTTPPPRPFTVVTDAQGSFTAQVDPGLYDVTVLPAEGSNLPSLVTSRYLVAAPTFGFPEQVVPAPIVKTYALYDPNSGGAGPVANALVRAYAVPPATTDGGAPGTVAVQIAEGTTDGNGTVELLLAGPPR